MKQPRFSFAEDSGASPSSCQRSESTAPRSAQPASSASCSSSLTESVLTQRSELGGIEYSDYLYDKSLRARGRFSNKGSGTCRAHAGLQANIVAEVPGGKYPSSRKLYSLNSHDINTKRAFLTEGFLAACPTLFDGKTHIVMRGHNCSCCHMVVVGGGGAVGSGSLFSPCGRKGSRSVSFIKLILMEEGALKERKGSKKLHLNLCKS